MSNENTYSEAEVRERERAAFAAGAEWCDNEIMLLDDGEAMEEARRRYPITRRVPRVVQLAPEFEAVAYISDDGALCFEHQRTGEPVDKCRLNAQSVRAIRTLLANPFEEIAE
jgi:hypothetical protein